MFQLRKVAAYAEMHNKLFVPHHGGSAIGIAAHLALSGGCPNSPYVELLQELPIVAAADFQGLIAPPYFEPDAKGWSTCRTSRASASSSATLGARRVASGSSNSYSSSRGRV